MREIGAFEARNNLGTLLDGVASGEKVLITRPGKDVARLLPAEPGVDRVSAGQAADNIRARSVGTHLGDLKIEDLVDEGRP